MIRLTIKPKNGHEWERVKHRLKHGMDDVLLDFNQQLGELALAKIAQRIVRDDAIASGHGIAETKIGAITPRYATIVTPGYMATLSRGRAPHHIFWPDLLTWARYKQVRNPRSARRRDVDKVGRLSPVPLAVRASKAIAARGVFPRKFIEHTEIDMERQPTRTTAGLLRRSIQKRFW